MTVASNESPRRRAMLRGPGFWRDVAIAVGVIALVAGAAWVVMHSTPTLCSTCGRGPDAGLTEASPILNGVPADSPPDDERPAH